MNQEDLEQDMRFFMNSQSAHNLILRALLRDNPKVRNQLMEFSKGMSPENEDEEMMLEELKVLLAPST